MLRHTTAVRAVESRIIAAPYAGRVSLDEGTHDLVAARPGSSPDASSARADVDWDHVRNQMAARRWVELTPRVIGTFTGALTRDQRCGSPCSMPGRAACSAG